jgi:hypothetical protein
MQNNQPVTKSPVEVKDNSIVSSGSFFNPQLDTVFSGIFSSLHNMFLTFIVVVHLTKFAHS